MKKISLSLGLIWFLWSFSKIFGDKVTKSWKRADKPRQKKKGGKGKEQGGKRNGMVAHKGPKLSLSIYHKYF